MKNKIAIVCSAILALFPYAVRADIDFLSKVEDVAKNVQEEINKQLETRTKGYLNLQRLTNSREAFETLKAEGKNFAKQQLISYASNIKLYSISVKGLKVDIKGSFATPDLIRNVGKKMTRKEMVSDDVNEALRHQKLINDLQVENLATMYAKALVLRRAIIDENKQIDIEEKLEMSDLTQITNAYSSVAQRASARWKTIMDTEANYIGQQATADLLNIRANTAKEEEEEAAAKSAKAAAEEEKKAATEKGNSLDGTGAEAEGVSLKELMDKGKQASDNIKNGDYGDTINDIRKGNYGDAIKGIGDTVSGTNGTGNIGDYITGAGNTLNNGSNIIGNVGSGNWTGALDDIANGMKDINNAAGQNEEEISKREAAQEEINKQNQEALKKAADELAQKANQDAINESLRKQGESSGIGRGSGWKLGPSGK